MRLTGRASLLVLFACGSRLPHPPYVQQRTEALIPVGFPPPPARVEFIPKEPAVAAGLALRGLRDVVDPGGLAASSAL